MIRVYVEMDLPSGRRLPCVDPSKTEFKFQTKKRRLHGGAQLSSSSGSFRVGSMPGLPRLVSSSVLQD